MLRSLTEIYRNTFRQKPDPSIKQPWIFLGLSKFWDRRGKYGNHPLLGRVQKLPKASRESLGSAEIHIKDVRIPSIRVELSPAHTCSNCTTSIAVVARLKSNEFGPAINLRKGLKSQKPPTANKHWFQSQTWVYPMLLPPMMPMQLFWLRIDSWHFNFRPLKLHYTNEFVTLVRTICIDALGLAVKKSLLSKIVSTPIWGAYQLAATGAKMNSVLRGLETGQWWTIFAIFEVREYCLSRSRK